MKRLFGIITLIAVLAAVLCACGQEAKPLADIFSEIKTDYDVTDMVEYTDVSELNRFYGIEAQDVKDFAGGVNNSGVDMEEIVMILAADQDAAERIATALSNRRDSKLNETKNYNPEQYAIVDNSTVDTDGNYVSLFISEHSGKMKADFKKAIGVAK